MELVFIIAEFGAISNNLKIWFTIVIWNHTLTIQQLKELRPACSWIIFRRVRHMEWCGVAAWESSGCVISISQHKIFGFNNLRLENRVVLLRAHLSVIGKSKPNWLKWKEFPGSYNQWHEAELSSGTVWVRFEIIEKIESNFQLYFSLLIYFLRSERMDHWPHIITPLKPKAEAGRQRETEGGKERGWGEGHTASWQSEQTSFNYFFSALFVWFVFS